MSDKADPRQMPVLKTRVPPPALQQKPGAVVATTYWRLVKYHILAGLLRFVCYFAPLFTLNKILYGLPEGIRVRKTKVPSRSRWRKVKVYIYKPSASNALYQSRLKQGDGKIPVHINMHGSGFVLPVWGSDSDFCAMVADTLGIVVIDSDYRKSPVHPFPAPLHDVEDVVKWVQSQPEYDGTRISLGGFSAGGNVAISVACILNSQAQALSQTSSSDDAATATPSPRLSAISAVATLYPACDLSVPPWGRKPIPQVAYDSGLVLPSWSIRFFHGSYLQRATDFGDWRASPVRADEGLFPPHMFIACGDADKLYEGAQKLVERLQAAGHPDASLLTLPRVSHGWDKLTSPGKKGWKERELAYKGYLDCLRRGLGDAIPS